jgi:hypothetical protein
MKPFIGIATGVILGQLIHLLYFVFTRSSKNGLNKDYTTLYDVILVIIFTGLTLSLVIFGVCYE